jgi:hypothetical protein
MLKLKINFKNIKILFKNNNYDDKIRNEPWPLLRLSLANLIHFDNDKVSTRLEKAIGLDVLALVIYKI